MSQASERVLIGRALEGDQRAFSSLYRAYRPRIYGMIAPRAVDRDDAEDVVQVTFVKAFQSLRKFRGDAAFATWLTRIALNVSNSHQRARWIRSARFLEVDDVDNCLGVDWGRVSSENPEDVVTRKEQRELVRKGIEGLPSQYREAMWLRYVKELTYLEITRELNVPMGTVKTWLLQGTANSAERVEPASVLGNVRFY